MYRVLLYQKCKIHDKNDFFTSDQNVSKNSLVRPSFSGDLSLGILFKALNSFFCDTFFTILRCDR